MKLILSRQTFFGEILLRKTIFLLGECKIYPLNPTKEEKQLLKNEERLSDDVNDEDNIIPLCEICHGKFDKPRTVKDYRYLFKLKKKLIDRSGQESIWKRYTIEDEISHIIEAIYDDPELENDAEIDFTPKEIDEKLNSTISRPTKLKIKGNVREYYIFIRNKFSELDNVNSDMSDLISLQIKTYTFGRHKLSFLKPAKNVGIDIIS